MHLVYFDETGNTGKDLNSLQQPVFVLCALLVSKDVWLDLEQALQDSIDKLLPPPRPDDFEIHGADLRNGTGCFRGVAINVRLAFRSAWLKTAREHQLKLTYRAIEKKRFQKWLLDAFGRGVSINPHVVAFPLLARVVDDYLRSLPGSPKGVFVLDENKDIGRDVEKSIRVLRGMDGSLRLGQIIEKGFFIDSRLSLPLQLCDLCAYSIRKKEERMLGLPAKRIDDGGIEGVEPLIHRGEEQFQDVIAWVTEQQKKGAARD